MRLVSWRQGRALNLEDLCLFPLQPQLQPCYFDFQRGETAVGDFVDQLENLLEVQERH